MTEQTDSIYSVQNEKLNSKLLSVHSRLGNSEKRAIFNLLSEAQSLSLAEREWLITNGKKKEYLETSIDSILQIMNGLYLIEYEIKTRFDENGKPGLKIFYALDDLNSIRFFNHKPVFEDYSETSGIFYQVRCKSYAISLLSYMISMLIHSFFCNGLYAMILAIKFVTK